MPVSSWSSTASANTSVGGLTTDGNIQTVNNIDGMFRGMMADIATARDDGTMTTYVPRGYLFGLTLSNNTGDATNDIDIAAGEAAADTSPYRKITLAAALTKRLDAAWAVGTNQGGLDTGSIADTTYHIWLIQRSDTSVVDVLFSASATAPTMPANYDRKRRIGSIRRNAGVIMPFYQSGDYFIRRSPAIVVSENNPGAVAVLRTMPVPTGIVVKAIISVNPSNTAAGVLFRTYVSSPSATDVAVDTINENVEPAALVAGRSQDTRAILEVETNTSAQIRTRHNGSDASCFLNISILGWVDTRGRIS